MAQAFHFDTPVIAWDGIRPGVSIPGFRGCETSEFDALIAEPPERERSRFNMDRKTVAGEISNGIHAIEAV